MNANGYCGNLLWQRGLTLVPPDPRSSCFKGIGVGSFYPFFKDITRHNWSKIFGPDVKNLLMPNLKKWPGVVIDPWESGGERLFPDCVREIESPTYWR